MVLRIALICLMSVLLSGCLVYKVAETAVDATATVVTTAVDTTASVVTGTTDMVFGSGDDDDDDGYDDDEESREKSDP